MQNQTHSDLEEMQRKLKRQWASKAKKKAENDPNTVKPTDSLMVLHAEELEFIEDLLYEVLESPTTKEKKKMALNILNHIQEED
ncbi:gp34.15 [Bacillus phage SPO1]|uniref:Gp34.15 n=1 Tax=Bacillus phage SP01 TaxID=2884427 RepID=B6V2T6_BPSP1|nr:gp34.15 [Bacillus phage SPO1]ACI91063.1 gp34.15 [Bacillus phage SPO1]WIT26495.1 hypothetical protein [Bacillus phage SPO1L4]